VWNLVQLFGTVPTAPVLLDDESMRAVIDRCSEAVKIFAHFCVWSEVFFHMGLPDHSMKNCNRGCDDVTANLNFELFGKADEVVECLVMGPALQERFGARVRIYSTRGVDDAAVRKFGTREVEENGDVCCGVEFKRRTKPLV
jgi:hypothetical protein